MTSMSYCRHENLANDLNDVWSQWDDYVPGTSNHEDRARTRIIRLVADMYGQFASEGEYDE